MTKSALVKLLVVIGISVRAYFSFGNSDINWLSNHPVAGSFIVFAWLLGIVALYEMQRDSTIPASKFVHTMDQAIHATMTFVHAGKMEEESAHLALAYNKSKLDEAMLLGLLPKELYQEMNLKLAAASQAVEILLGKSEENISEDFLIDEPRSSKVEEGISVFNSTLNYKLKPPKSLSAQFQSKVPENLKIDASSAQIAQFTYQVNYRDHYSHIFKGSIPEQTLAELYLFRAWTTQFGYRIQSTNPEASEKLIGETINSTNYLGLDAFEKLHGFSIEDVLSGKYLQLIASRWYQYDEVIVKSDPDEDLPTGPIIGVLNAHINNHDPIVTMALALDFGVQMIKIQQRAIEIGVLKIQ